MSSNLLTDTVENCDRIKTVFRGRVIGVVCVLFRYASGFKYCLHTVILGKSDEAWVSL